MNYGEEIGYWYLRLNGFFPLANFVVHAGGEIRHSADVDLLAVRAPHTFEAVGGQPHDLDPYLKGVLGGFSHLTGVICEVKTGGLDPTKLFPEERLKYAIDRLGLCPQSETKDLAYQLRRQAVVRTESGYLLSTLLISDTLPDDVACLHRTVRDADSFLKARVANYPIEKFRDRMFFPDGVFQYVAGMKGR